MIFPPTCEVPLLVPGGHGQRMVLPEQSYLGGTLVVRSEVLSGTVLQSFSVEHYFPAERQNCSCLPARPGVLRWLARDEMQVKQNGFQFQEYRWI